MLKDTDQDELPFFAFLHPYLVECEQNQTQTTKYIEPVVLQVKVGLEERLVQSERTRLVFCLFACF